MNVAYVMDLVSLNHFVIVKGMFMIAMKFVEEIMSLKIHIVVVTKIFWIVMVNVEAMRLKTVSEYVMVQLF